MSRTKQEKNKALVLEAFDTLFNKRDYVAALLRTRLWYMICLRHEKVREHRCSSWSCSWRGVRNDRDVGHRTSCPSCLLGD